VTRRQLTDDRWKFVEPYLQIGKYGPYLVRLRMAHALAGGCRDADPARVDRGGGRRGTSARSSGEDAGYAPAALLRPGGTEGAVLHLMECMRTLNHLTVQSMPNKRHTHAGLQGPMQLMSTEEGRDLVFVESTGRQYVDLQAGQVNGLFDLFGML